MPELEQAAREWAAHFNAGRYFEAHEALEEAWRAAPQPQKTWLKGMIHAAVALYQYQRGNDHGARTKYGSALHYLSGAPDSWLGLDIARLRRELTAFMAALTALAPGSPVPEPRVPWPRARRKQ
jgi:predicted metal-dependent hydrolase